MAVPFFAAFNLLDSPTKIFEESLVRKGYSGEYKYEVWNTSDTTGYYLKVWKIQVYPYSEPLRVIGSFNSKNEALEHLSSNYT
jgi:hypothetical protein